MAFNLFLHNNGWPCNLNCHCIITRDCCLLTCSCMVIVTSGHMTVKLLYSYERLWSMLACCCVATRHCVNRLLCGNRTLCVNCLLCGNKMLCVNWLLCGNKTLCVNWLLYGVHTSCWTSCVHRWPLTRWPLPCWRKILGKTDPLGSCQVCDNQFSFQISCLQSCLPCQLSDQLPSVLPAMSTFKSAVFSLCLPF